MPATPYHAPLWLAGGHAQTIWAYRLRRRSVPVARERVETSDGDFWDFDWLDAPAKPGAPLVALFHGLEGGSRSHYAGALLRALARAGWRGVVPHFRGCGGEPNRLPRAYHSGDFEEVGAMLAYIRGRFGGPMYAVGVSLGGSALLNWIGRQGAAAGDTLRAAATASVPLDLMAAGLAIDRGLNRMYAKHFLRTLVPKALAMAQRFPGTLDARRVARARTMYEFDDCVTSPLHGFAGTDDYWTRAAAKPHLHRIRIPALVLNARNDPFVPGHSLPRAAEVGAYVTLWQPGHGGHVGFAAGGLPGHLLTMPEQVCDWLGKQR